MIKPISAGELKHIGVIKTATSYTATGQPTGWETLCAPYFGIDNEAVSPADEANNTGNKKTLTLFSRYDARIQNSQAVFIFGALYLISQLDNVEFANVRVNFTATEL
jgi:hypothetical protein